MTAIIPHISKLTSRIIRILGCNPGPMTLQGTNTYVIGTGKRRILLDTGDAGKEEYIKGLMSVLKQHDIALETIIITHWHHDHIGGLPDVIQAIQNEDCKVWKFKRKDESNNDMYEGVKLNYLTDNQEILTEGASLRMIYTPGHTTDHVSVFMKEENALFSGDCILGEGTAVFEDLYHYMKSLELMLSLKPFVIFPGHGPVVEKPLEVIQYYINHRNQREQEILEVLRKANGKSMDEMDIVKIIYSDKSEYLQLMAAHNVNHHLKKLLKENKIRQVSNGWEITNSKL